MKRNSKFKIIFVVIIGIIVLALSVAIQAKGEVANERLNKYVAIGDEISIEASNDYDIEYVSLIRDFLYALNNNLDYSNLSKEGITSFELLNIIDDNKDKIKDTDIITISIGGNNILNPILKNLNVDESILENYDEDKFDSLISEYLNSEEIKTEILNEVNKFSKDFPNIIKKLKKLAPEADIYVNTVYNPIN